MSYTKETLSKLMWSSIDLTKLNHWRWANMKTGSMLDVLRFRYKTANPGECVVEWRAVTNGESVYKLYPKMIFAGIAFGLVTARLVRNELRRERAINEKYDRSRREEEISNSAYERGEQRKGQELTGWGNIKESDIKNNLDLISAIAYAKNLKAEDEAKRLKQAQLAEVAKQLPFAFHSEKGE